MGTSFMLEVAKLSARLEFLESATFPAWLGNAFRGGIGVHLRQASCDTLEKDCYSCAGRSDCLFYHTHMKKESKVGYGAPPKPIIFIPPFFGKRFTARETNGFLPLKILLFGRFIRHLPSVVFGLRLLGQSGLGFEGRGDINTFQLTEMSCDFSNEVVYDGRVISSGALKAVNIANYVGDSLPLNEKLSLGFETPIMVKTGGFPPSLEKLLRMIRQRLILYVNEYGDRTTIPEFACQATINSSKAHFHTLGSHSQREGRREFHAYTGTVEYTIEQMDEPAKQLLRIGLLLGAGPKPSFGLGFLKEIERR